MWATGYQNVGDMFEKGGENMKIHNHNFEIGQLGSGADDTVLQAFIQTIMFMKIDYGRQNTE